MPVGKKLVVVASVLATGACAAFFFRKDASQLTPWQEAQDESPFRMRVERRVAADAAQAESAAGTRMESAPQTQSAFRIPTAETAAIRQQPLENSVPTFQKNFNPVGALLEPIETVPDEAVNGATDRWDDFAVDDTPGSTALEHRITDGDTLSTLAARYLGRGDRYLEIFDHNREKLTSPDLLPIGVVLKIPSRRAPARSATPLDAHRDNSALDSPPGMVPVERNGAGREASG